MKKLTALFLALLMVLSGTLALAEAAAAPSGLSVTGEISVDREAAKTLMSAYGMEDAMVQLADSALAVLDALGYRLIVADSGAELGVSLNGKDVLSLAGEFNDDGLVIGSTLFPNYVLTASSDSIVNFVQSLTEKAADKVPDLGADAQNVIQQYAGDFVNEALAAFNVGEAETGEFEFDGKAFNTRTPITVDVPAFVGAAKGFFEKLENDETVKAALEAAKARGVDIGKELEIPEDVDAAKLPAIEGAIYTNVDEAGNQGSATYISVDVTNAGAEAPTALIDLSVDEGNILAQVEFTESKVTLQCAVDYDETNCNIQFAVFSGEDMYVTLNINVDVQEDIVIVSDLYVMDAEKPVATETETITFDGVRTYTVSADGKTAVALENLTGEEDTEALSGLAMDLLMNGLGGALTTATEAVPEIGNLTSLLLGGSDAA